MYVFPKAQALTEPQTGSRTPLPCLVESLGSPYYQGQLSRVSPRRKDSSTAAQIRSRAGRVGQAKGEGRRMPTRTVEYVQRVGEVHELTRVIAQSVYDAADARPFKLTVVAPKQQIDNSIFMLQTHHCLRLPDRGCLHKHSQYPLCSTKTFALTRHTRTMN